MNKYFVNESDLHTEQNRYLKLQNLYVVVTVVVWPILNSSCVLIHEALPYKFRKFQKILDIKINFLNIEKKFTKYFVVSHY